MNALFANRNIQVIEEGYILDVLQNYTTYQSYYKIREKGGSAQGHKIAGDSIYDTQKAYKKLNL